MIDLRKRKMRNLKSKRVPVKLVDKEKDDKKKNYE